MTKWISSFFLFTATLVCAENSQSDLRESLQVRRIAEYWKEGDFEAAKSRIQTFLAEYPHSSYGDHLKAMLGDLYVQEGLFKEGKALYEQIESKEWKSKVFLSFLRCLYEEKNYQELLSLSSLFLEKEESSLEDKNLVYFLHAESYYHLGDRAEGEEKLRLFQIATAHYQVLKSTSYRDATLFPLAKMALVLGDFSEAASLHLLLSEKYPERKEEFLFEVALCQAQFSPKEAIATLKRVYPLQGKLAEEAAFYELELLFQEERYREVVESFANTSKLFSEKKLSKVHYLVGKSLFTLSHYKEAIPLLSACLKTADLDKKTLKNILLALSVSAEKEGDAPLFRKTLKELLALFGDDLDTSEVVILHAQFSEKTGMLQEASSDFELLLKKFPTHPKKEAILYDHGLLLSKMKEWHLAASSFETLLTEFPTTQYLAKARRHQIFCLFEDLKNTPSGTETLKRQYLVKTIQTAIEDETTFLKAEKKQIHYLLGKTLYDLGQFDEALLTLNEFVSLYPKDAHVKQAHLLIAYSHFQGTHDDMLFVIHAEKALEEHAVIADLNTLHLQLYNAYLNLAKKGSSEKQKFIDEAAGHLFAALEGPLSKDNLFWLSQYYEKKIELDPSYLPKAIAILEKVLELSSNRFSPNLQPLELETCCLKLSSLYEKAGNIDGQITVLKALREEQKKETKSWKYQRLVLFELAKSYEHKGECQKALDLYDFLITSSTHTPSYFGPAAELQKLKLLYKNLEKKEGQELDAILDGLKSLEIRKRLSSEPAHLEAALTYIAIKADLAKEEEKLKITLHLMEKMKEDFSNISDPLTEHYLSVAHLYPEEKHLLDDYIAYLACQILKVQGVIQGSEELAKLALIELESMRKKPLHPSLKKWVDMNTNREALPRIR